MEEDFEKWFNVFKNEDPEKNLWYVLMKPFMKIAWEAAIKTIGGK